jgi:hypothetical protein
MLISFSRFSKCYHIHIQELLTNILFKLVYLRFNLAGNCFYHRTHDVCYDVSEVDSTEEQCTGSYYSDDNLKELDGYVYAENCRDVNGM